MFCTWNLSFKAVWMDGSWPHTIIMLGLINAVQVVPTKCCDGYRFQTINSNGVIVLVITPPAKLLRAGWHQTTLTRRTSVADQQSGTKSGPKNSTCFWMEIAVKSEPDEIFQVILTSSHPMGWFENGEFQNMRMFCFKIFFEILPDINVECTYKKLFFIFRISFTSFKRNTV